MSAQDDDNLKAFWTLICPAAPEGTIEEEQQEPGTVVLGVRERALVTLRPDGTIEFGGGYEPEEAARLFWMAVGRAHPNLQLIDQEAEVRALTTQTMEMLLVRLGRADIECERARAAASREDATERDKFMDEMATKNLEVEAHRVIEFARGLAQRGRNEH